MGFPERRRVTLPAVGDGRDDVELVVHDWGGEGPLVLLHHATGMCAATWAPVAEALRDTARVIAFDARGHGDASKPEGEYTWQAYADDLVRLAERLCSDLGRERVDVAVGHSLGGIASLMAMHDRPTLFASGVLIEPALVTPQMEGDNPRRRDGLTRASLATRMRQAHFGSRREARECLLSQPLFEGWPEAQFETFLSEGLAIDAEGLHLKCPPILEAKIYSLGAVAGLFDAGYVDAPLLIQSAKGSRFAGAHALFAAQSADAQIAMSLLI